MLNILRYILARAGLRLVVRSASETITGYFPDFTVHPGDSGDKVIDRLLSFVPDALFIEGGDVYLVNPLATDVPEYEYGGKHAVESARYIHQATVLNWARVEGRETTSGEAVTADFFNWESIEREGEARITVRDINLGTDQLAMRGAAVLRKADIKSRSGEITVPVNCGQQLYDVISIKDGSDGNRTARVTGLELTYEAEQSRYRHRILLSGV